MDTIKYIALIFLLVGNITFGQKNEEVILWEPDVKLSWSDFKDTPPALDRAAATTASGITYQFSTSFIGDKMEVDFLVETHFYPNKSWYKKDLCDDVILSHEQLHFDISELYAQKMRKQLSEAKFTKNIKAEVRKIYKSILKELNDFQNRYDDETNFSRNIEEQLRWNAMIKRAVRN